MLIKHAWSTMLGVKEIPKVHTVNLILFIWLCDLFLWVVCWSKYLCAQFNMVLEPRWTRHFSSLDLLLDHCFEQFCNFAPSSTASKAYNLPLNIPSKGIVDQAFLINYDRCDESLKCVAIRPYSAPFVVICRF